MGGKKYHISFKTLSELYSGKHKFDTLKVVKGIDTRSGGGGGTPSICSWYS